MITKTQAINENVFHYGNCLAYYKLIYNRMSNTVVSRANPDRFYLLVTTFQEIKEKRIGLTTTMELTNENAEDFHIPSECPILIKQEKDAEIQ